MLDIQIINLFDTFNRYSRYEYNYTIVGNSLAGVDRIEFSVFDCKDGLENTYLWGKFNNHIYENRIQHDKKRNSYYRLEAVLDEYDDLIIVTVYPYNNDLEEL